MELKWVFQTEVFLWRHFKLMHIGYTLCGAIYLLDTVVLKQMQCRHDRDERVTFILWLFLLIALYMHLLQQTKLQPFLISFHFISAIFKRLSMWNFPFAMFAFTSHSQPSLTCARILQNWKSFLRAAISMDSFFFFVSHYERDAFNPSAGQWNKWEELCETNFFSRRPREK